MATTSDRNAEIWSTRLQREILALESPSESSKKPPVLELLPPFITTLGHTLNIEGGIAKIEFRIDVEKGVEVDAAAVVEDDKEKETLDEEGEAAHHDNVEKTETKEETTSDKGEAQEDDIADNTIPEPDAGTENIADRQDTTNQDSPHIILVLDASMYWEQSSSSDDKSSHPQFYPFMKPLAVIKSGSDLFSGGSTIGNGDEIDIDLDWTPSIHLSDAVTHVALKIRECVKRGEPLHPSQRQDNDDDGDEEGLLSTTASLIKEEAKETILETKKAVGAIFSSFAARGSVLGSSLAAKSQSMRGTLTSAVGEGLSALVTEASRDGPEENEEADDDEEEEEEEKNEEQQNKGGLPEIGQEIDLSDEPWNTCIGMYSVKAIKRAEFIETAMEEAAAKKKKPETTSTSYAMFSRFAQSAKSAMEETFLMITEEYIVEFKSNRLNIGTGTVTFSISIDQMAKLKFRREESLSLFFKEATNDPLVYMCLDSALAVQDIQSVLKRHGVKGKHTNAATQRAVQMALNMVGLIQQKEAELIDHPNVDRVNEIMDLYRQAAEKFELAGDPRHAEVMAHMKRFLNQAFTTSILDGSFVSEQKASSAGTASSSILHKSAPAAVPQGEIIEQPKYNLSNDDDDDDDIPLAASTSSSVTDDFQTPLKLKKSLQDVDDVIEEAKGDLKGMGIGDDDINVILNSPPSKSGSKDDDDFAELNAMFSEADKELNDLLNS